MMMSLRTNILQLKNYVYGRKTNPTVDAVEASINSITDNAAGTLVYSSGVAAVTTALTFFLSPGDHLVRHAT